MADDAIDAKEAVVAPPAAPQEPAVPESSPEKTKEPEVAGSDDFLDGFDPKEKKSKSDTEDKPKVKPTKDKEPEVEENPKPIEETEEKDQPQDEEKPEDKPRPKNAQDRIRSLANENRALKEQIEQTNAKVYQPQSVEDLIAEGESEAMAEVKALRQEREIERYNQQVMESQSALNQESQQILTEFPMFNPESEDYKPDISAGAAELFEANLIRDPNTAQVDQQGQPIPGTGQIIGFHASPYQIYKPIADAYQASAQENQIKGQKANERMLASVDAPSSAAPKEAKQDDFLSGLLGTKQE